MQVLKEFKEFAVRGNVIDLAVGVIIGAAFGKIINSLVEDIIMPPIAVIIGRYDFANRFLTLSGPHTDTLAQAREAGAITLNYGNFINNIVTFLIVAMAIFMVIRQMNKLSRKPAEETTPSLRDCPQCLSPIPSAATRCKFCGQAV
jgi:large conductance mechanosensitive channel